MRTIRIVSNGVPIDVYDKADKSVEDALMEVIELLKGDSVIAIVGVNSGAAVRPSSVTAISILDEDGKVHHTKVEPSEPTKNGEQNTEGVDMIVDLEN